jgi:hypothetical protein
MPPVKSKYCLFSVSHRYDPWPRWNMGKGRTYVATMCLSWSSIRRPAGESDVGSGCVTAETTFCFKRLVLLGSKNEDKSKLPVAAQWQSLCSHIVELVLSMRDLRMLSEAGGQQFGKPLGQFVGGERLGAKGNTKCQRIRSEK